MIQVPPVQVPQPSYNAVKIDIHNPSVNTPSNQPAQAPVEQAPVTAPIYNSIPQASIYEVPKQSIYQQQEAKPALPMPSVPQPVVIPPTVAPVASVDVKAAPAPQAPAVEPKVETAPAPVQEQIPAAVPQKVEIKTAEVLKPAVDVNAFISKLTNPDFEIQAGAMEEIAVMAQKDSKSAAALLDVKVVDALLGIMQADSSKLEGPTASQLQAREKIIAGKPVTEAETAEANKVTPMELAERNKQYSIYTVAILQKLYGAEIESLNGQVIPMTELPGAAGIVEQVKNNPNPMVRASAIDALSYIQRPEYKQDLTTLFTVAKNDKDTGVQQAATRALDKLAAIVTPAPASVVEAPKA